MNSEQRIFFSWQRITWLVAFFVWIGIKLTANAQSEITITLDPLVNGLISPVALTHAGDGTGRLFVLEQPGRIRILRHGNLLAAPYLDITSLVSYGGEKGLLGLAFHPNYKNNGRFFVDYTSNRPNLKTIIAEYRVNGANQDLAGSTERVFLEIDQPYENHNGGQLQFGPDGFLYIGMGDGGSGGDPQGNGQNKNSLLGKILRIDVDHGSPYEIPPDNPFRNGGGAPEIWAWGLRNPWRFSFDRLNGRLFAGDVGQNLYEEVDIVEGAGNYGWNIMEGLHCYSPVTGCETSGLKMPIHEYDHSIGACVIGGYVYRGRQYPALHGLYLFGDYVSQRIWTLTEDLYGAWTRRELLNTGFPISSFGEDEAGEMYVVDLGGSVYKIRSTTPLPGNSGLILIPSSTKSARYVSSLSLLNRETFPLEVELTSHDGSGIETGISHFMLAPLAMFHSNDILGTLNLPLGSFGPLTLNAAGVVNIVSEVQASRGTGGLFLGAEVSDASPDRLLLNVSDTGDSGVGGTRRTNIGMDNPGDSPASVQVSLINNSGSVEAEKRYSVAPHGMMQVNNILRDLKGWPSATGLSGYLRLQADQPIHAWASEIDNGTDDPSVGTAIGNEMVFNGVKLLIPSAVGSDTFKSSLLVVNRESQSTRIALTLRDPAGTLMGTLNRTLDSHGFWRTDDIITDLNLPSGSYGPLLIESLDGRLLSAISEVKSRTGTGGLFAAMNLGAATLNCLAVEILDNGNPGIASTFRTNLGINNPQSLDAHVLLELADETGNHLSSQTLTVSAGGLVQINQVLKSFPNFQTEPLKRYYLSLKSDQAIFGWVSKIENATNDPSLIMAFP